ncbi:UDP-N-acetylmuramate dehydrogenase [Epidermidibacterium keratini]|uniref:UDP-N-acetylenolpyruvoylglucosamine reductase n=1 Tax=Epidermidibacterium keratini TaxID=1891644 RepID=A0A7L4YKT6_9ACTN|nr:UDP-N-acetylmuramate dehydrogenase [Epidermidibacterium keratini]QHB99815.1 UDP-N-acetylmuramate dehydrogenase [Epidermidibacterium keratini]
MSTAERAALADYTTLRVGGSTNLTRTTSEDELVDAVQSAEDAGDAILLLGGGSNLVVSDDGFPGTTIGIGHTGIDAQESADRVTVRVAAGESWDELVARAVEAGWSGLEAMSGIPGLVGATPIQNVGAYGAETSDVLISVDVWDRQRHERRTLSAAECGFGYRSSIFKYAHRYVVLAVTFELARSEQSAPVRYAELARTLGVTAGESAPLGAVREAVLGLRGGKGMVLDAADHDTWSAGSFFTNPILPAIALPEGAPTYPADDGMVKTSAAWLIEHAGFHKGFGNDRAALSSKHTLAITNRGSASTADIVELAREIRDEVRGTFGIELHPEPLLIGCSL